MCVCGAAQLLGPGMRSARAGRVLRADNPSARIVALALAQATAAAAAAAQVECDCAQILRLAIIRNLRP